MKKTTIAKVKYREYIPYGWSEIDFCDVKFTGSKKIEMSKAWTNIKHARYEKYNEIYEKNKLEIAELIKKANETYKLIKNSRPFYRFWNNREETKKIAQADEMLQKANKLELENEKVGAKRFFTIDESRQKIRQLLTDSDFSLISVNVGEEIWSLEE